VIFELRHRALRICSVISGDVRGQRQNSRGSATAGRIPNHCPILPAAQRDPLRPMEVPRDQAREKVVSRLRQGLFFRRRRDFPYTGSCGFIAIPRKQTHLSLEKALAQCIFRVFPEWATRTCNGIIRSLR
jgi:hypothetical protein